MRSRNLILLCGAVSLFGGCGDASGPELDIAAEALAVCDVRTANAAYETAYSASSGNGDAALGFALTDMVLMGEDPAAVAGLGLWGFTGSIDSEMMLWGTDGLLASLSEHRTGSSYGDHVTDNFPYPPVRARSFALDLVDPRTTALDVMEQAWALQPRFLRISQAFETAAENAPLTIEIGGHCGLGEVAFQAPELYLLAATYQAISFALQITRGYSWDFAMLDVIESRGDTIERMRARAEILNTHLGAISNASALAGIQDEYRRLARLLLDASNAARDIGAPPPQGLFDWPRIPPDLAPTLVIDGEAALALASGDSVQAPGLTPRFDGTFAPLFGGTADLSGYGRTFSVYEDPMWGDYWMETDTAPIDMLLMSVLSPSPFDDTLRNVEWSHTEAWTEEAGEWQIVDVESTVSTLRSARVPGFISPVIARYIDTLRFQ